MTKKQKWLIGISAAVLIVLIAGALFLWKGCSAKPEEGMKSITFQVKYEDEVKDYDIKTDEEFLAKALAEEKIITYDEGGFYTTISGITADYDKDKAFWWISCNGVDLQVGMNEQPIKDGDNYVATYTVSQ